MSRLSRSSLLVVLLAVLLGGCGGEKATTPPASSPAAIAVPRTPAQPEAYRSPDGLYRVRFGGKTKREVRHNPSEDGEHTSVLTMHTPREGIQSVLNSTLTGVGRRFCDADQGDLGAETLQKMRCHVVEAAPRTVSGVVGTLKDFVCDDGHSGVLLALCDGSQIASAKIARTYLVFALYSDPISAKSAHEFVTSFELIPAP